MSGQALATRRFSLEHKVDEFRLLFFSNAVGIVLLFAFKTLWYGWSDLANFTLPPLLADDAPGLHWKPRRLRRLLAALKCIPAAMASLLCTMEIVVAVVLTAISSPNSIRPRGRRLPR